MIELSDISLSYHTANSQQLILKKLDLKINKGEMIAILGASGSGKSTLLYILGGLLRPSSGSYKFEGENISEYSDEELSSFRNRRVGFIFQQFHLLPRANLIENLLLVDNYNPSRKKEKSHNRAVKLLTEFGLEQHLSHFPNQLSGGQQQRVAITRALMNEPDIILADEPTGNLDSKNTEQILKVFRQINQNGKTIVIITHDHEVAKSCDRVLNIRDGQIVSSKLESQKNDVPQIIKSNVLNHHLSQKKISFADLKSALNNIFRNKTRSLLTMLGVIIGVSAVLITITLGQYTQRKILEGYESLGVNKLIIRAYPNWGGASKNLNKIQFEELQEQSDIKSIQRLFNEVQLITPVITAWLRTVQFAGKSADDIRGIGVNSQYFQITNRQISEGHFFSDFHVKNNVGVCVIGHEVAQTLFLKNSGVGQIIIVSGNNDSRFSCRVIGVMKPQVSNNEWFKPNRQIILPYSYLQIAGDRWNSKIYELNVKILSSGSIEDLSQRIIRFLDHKYGNTAITNVDSDEILVAQMRKFLTLFSVLLTGVALISLLVGAVGITNMMLVSVSERIKEIGLRRALGATKLQIRNLFLSEAMMICIVAGILGVFSGVAGYHLILYMASKLFTKIQFEWMINIWAVFFSFICIASIGLISGLIPALKAEDLDVVEALRTD